MSNTRRVRTCSLQLNTTSASPVYHLYERQLGTKKTENFNAWDQFYNYPKWVHVRECIVIGVHEYVHAWLE